MDGFLAHFEPYESIFDNFGDLAFGSDSLPLFRGSRKALGRSKSAWKLRDLVRMCYAGLMLLPEGPSTVFRQKPRGRVQCPVAGCKAE